MPIPSNLSELTAKNYTDQAKWFLNGYWNEGAKDNAEAVWKITHKFMEYDEKKKDGSMLDEFWSHKLLESQGQTLTVVDLRAALRQIDMDKDGKMALLEYLLHTYGKTPDSCLKSPQGSNQHEIEAAAEKLQAVQDAYTEVKAQLEVQTQALAQQKAAEEQSRKDVATSTQAATQAKADEAEATKSAAVAKEKLQEQVKAQEVVQTAEAELRAALEELKRQEQAYIDECNSLQAKSTDASLPNIQQKKAANELAQLKETDPLPLRRAKLTAEAALKKVEKERKNHEAATTKAVESHAVAEKASQQSNSSVKALEQAQVAAQASAAEAQTKREQLEESTKKVEQASKDTEARMAEAQEMLNVQKQAHSESVAHGAIWWMEREIKEVQKYLPKNKQTAV